MSSKVSSKDPADPRVLQAGELKAGISSKAADMSSNAADMSGNLSGGHEW